MRDETVIRPRKAGVFLFLFLSACGSSLSLQGSSASANLQVEPSMSFTFSGPAGVVVEPNSAVYPLANLDARSLDWEATSIDTQRTSMASALSQFGITWTFDHDYPTGQFANGDWWVVGPVTIVQINPLSTDVGGRTMNGSMVNPPATSVSHGYDSSMFGIYENGQYDPTLNRALDVSAANPLVLPPQSSLVSTISLPTAGERPQLRVAAILTVLGAPAPAGSFRPWYCGNNKTVFFNKSQLHVELLASLPPVSTTPDLGTVERYFERPWLDHIPGWMARWQHPLDNMNEYGADLAGDVSIGALMLHLDFTEAEKETLLIRYVQLGIDWFGVVFNGGTNNWTPNGGHASGRKWPILFGALMLFGPAIGGIGLEHGIYFGEDGQTFFVEETSPGVFNNGHGGYGPMHVGLPEWGNRHATSPALDEQVWTADPYRVCCTANNWTGFVLAARIMGAKELWNNDALFLYQRRYLQTMMDMGAPGWQVSMSPFTLEMWNTYSNSF